MSGAWHDCIRKRAQSVGLALARWLVLAGMPDAMTRHARNERRADLVTADVVQVGVCFMSVFGADTAEAYFSTAAIAPAVYRRIVAGRFRRMARRGDPEPESVPA